MGSLPHDVVALSLLVFVLGVKHGFDADHLATIDGLTRFNARAKPGLARYCGALFSIGHGVVVVMIALLVSTVSQRWQTPEWLTASGALVSIGFLAVLGLLNLHAVLRADPNEVVQPIGLKGRFLGRFASVTSPLLIATVGALFALSFDTISQASLFALTAAQLGGWGHALTMGLLFMLGMLVTDGINGLWISRLIYRADQIAVIASRIMSLVVAGMSLVIAGFGVAKLAVPAVEHWTQGSELIIGAVVVVVVAVSYLVAVRLAPSRQVAVAARR
jgi:nickel/cobalt transporter (NiCoT) family protein